ncbi:MAG: tRNA (N6-isopentenyl adenosine(37)-C2)-methylthiotransferase MiaB, partial [Anaerolineales bacterium]|nr:tRNA (N6-isopentenyl adenosine(37)-C2)-methylthiotransferase MiaB [Anaerolineales bacterium]
EKVRGRWRGRTPTNKLVFVETDKDLRGKTLPVTITWTGPWSMQGALPRLAREQIPINVAISPE